MVNIFLGRGIMGLLIYKKYHLTHIFLKLFYKNTHPNNMKYRLKAAFFNILPLTITYSNKTNPLHLHFAQQIYINNLV